MAESVGEARTESFEAALQRLAELVAGLESGSLGLSESIAAYERGVGILKRLHDELAVAEERVKVLVRIDEEGRPVLEAAAPTGDSAAAAESAQTAASRSARTGRTKNAKPRQLPGMDDADAS
jgi:exodeoxyribonuclease VII small subunit